MGMSMPGRSQALSISAWGAVALLFFCGLLSAFSAGPLAGQEPLRVAAAADLEPVLPPILDRFRAATGIATEVTYKSSAVLTTQIENGAPFDVFFSADMGFPKRLIDAGLADPSGSADSTTPVLYARGTLVLWERRGTPLPAPSLDLLRSPELKRLAIADPERAPYGRAAVAALTKLHLYGGLKPRIVTGENIAQAAQFAYSGNADAGLISMTSAVTSRMQAAGEYFVIPRDLYPRIEQGVVIVSGTKQRAAAHKLIEYVLSATVQAELARSGLAPAK